MSVPKHNASKFLPLTSLFAFGITFSGYAIDQQCVDRHEICPDHYKQTTYSPSYQEMLKNKSSVRPVAITAAPVETVALDDDKDGVNNTLDKCPETPIGYKVDRDGCPKSVTLHINFAFASSVLPESSDKDTQILTEFLQENPASTISIIGHTDHIGMNQTNQMLSMARAKALQDKLILLGIAKERIQSSGKGENNPIATNKTNEGRAKNRRVEVLIK
uniref:OmpA-like domain-containing protein n=1 Tax=uncultured bacterium pBF1 TaxID=1781162 RepID=A0A1C9U579_9BACT|nr:hypothetical protein [uncultured bacterium pBF1]